ncbi:hypothetical protein QI600_004291 [Salmonella enterica]|nr:hypothetical protein [Salmonella enterica]
MKYILLFISITGGLLSFNSYSAVTKQCSASASPVTGSYTFIVIDGVVHANVNGCDYVLPPNSPVPSDDAGFCGGNIICSQESTWYPTGNLGIGDSNKSQPIISGNSDTSQAEVDKINEQTQRYCSQTKKCDSDGEPTDINDFIDFVKKDDALHNQSSDKPGDSDNTGDSGSTRGDSTSSGQPDNTPSTPDITPPAIPAEPDFSIPDNAGYAQLSQLFLSCDNLSNYYKNPHDSSYNPAVDEAFNAHVDKCNAIYDKINNSFPPGGKFTLNKDSNEFLTKRFDGKMVHCRYQPHIGSDMSGQVMSRSAHREVVQHPVFPVYDPDNAPLVFNYPAAQPRWITTLCETVADRPDSVNDLYNGNNPDNNPDNRPDNKPDNKSDNKPVNPGACLPGRDSACTFVPSGPGACPAGTSYVPGSDIPGDVPLCRYGTGNYVGKDASGKPVVPGGGSGGVVNPGMMTGGGSGSGNTDKDGNGDVVAAVNAFHADANKNHEETMKALDASGADIDSIKGGLSSDINKLTGDVKNEMTNSYNEALGEIKSVFGDIDAYIPDIKLSFDLPAQFTAGILGRCVPLVFDFNISLVGLEPYHFHAEGIQACKLYDDYIRSVVEYMLYFITALACRRVFTRAAEFLTSQG